MGGLDVRAPRTRLPVGGGLAGPLALVRVHIKSMLCACQIVVAAQRLFATLVEGGGLRQRRLLREAAVKLGWRTLAVPFVVGPPARLAVVAPLDWLEDELI